MAEWKEEKEHNLRNYLLLPCAITLEATCRERHPAGAAACPILFDHSSSEPSPKPDAPNCVPSGPNHAPCLPYPAPPHHIPANHTFPPTCYLPQMCPDHFWCSLHQCRCCCCSWWWCVCILHPPTQSQHDTTPAAPTPNRHPPLPPTLLPSPDVP